ncbi:MAG: nuclear transport factor 2 family protein [Acidobacteriota bacterium]
MTDIATLETELNQQILSGDIMGAFERYYADDVVMVEPGVEPHEGKAINREREQQFVASVAEFHGAEVKAAAVVGDVSFSEWTMDITFQDGNRALLEQVAVRRWKDGLVVHERFYYNKG